MANSNPPTPGPIVVPPTPPQFPQTDDARAVEFINEWLDDNFKFIYAWRQWAFWDGTCWKLDPSGRHESMIWREAQAFATDMLERAEALPPGPAQDQAISAARKAQSADHRASMIKIIKSDIDIGADPTDFDADPMLLGVQNGVVDLRTGEYREVEKEDLILKKCSIPYDANTKCPMWEEFLEQILPDSEVRDYVQRAIGYALTGKTTEQVLFFFYGMGQNGKSTFIETIERILGDYVWRTSAELFLDGRSSENKLNTMAALPEKRFVVGAEMPEGAHLAENRIKDLSGGDKIQARKLYCEAFNYYPTHKLFFYGNHKPIVRGNDKGIWRRINMVPFTVEIPDEKRDRNIVERLWTERCGILNWSIAGCLEWQNGGLRPPKAVRYATESYREDEDLIGEFLNAECERTGEISRAALSANFMEWAKAAGYKFSPSPRAVNERVRREPGISEKTVQGIRKWNGLSMKDPASFRHK